MLVYVQNSRGDIIWENVYDGFQEMVQDLAVLEKPSIFGNSNFRVVIEHGPLALNPTVYVNLGTGEITEDRVEAMEWYRDGDGVEVRKNNKTILTMVL